jgi:hypothetical protein
MSQVKIKRLFRVVDVSVTTSTASATTLRTDDMAGAVLLIGTQNTNAATVQVWGSNTDTGTFGQLYDSSGSVQSITLAPSSTAGRCYALPDAAYALPYVKLVAATTNANATYTAIMKT